MKILYLKNVLRLVSPHNFSLYVDRQTTSSYAYFLHNILFAQNSEKTANSTDPKLNSVILNLQLLLFSFVLDLMGDNIIYYQTPNLEALKVSYI